MRMDKAKPFPFDWEPHKSALLVIDMQRDFVEKGGFGEVLGNDVSRLAPCIPVIASLLAAFRAAGLTVIHTVEGHRPDLSDCPPAKRLRGPSSLRIGDEGPMGRILVLGEAGNAIIPELAPLPHELVVEKPGKGAFYRTNLEVDLRTRGIEQLVVCGVTTEVCVQTTLREANDRGFDCLLVEDGTDSYFPAFKQAVLDMVVSQGAIVGWTATSSSVLEAMRSSAPSEAVLDGLGGWHFIQPGLAKRSLHRVGSTELALLRYEAGARAPLHRHSGRETIWVLEGEQEDERGVYPAGSKVVNEQGSSHAVSSRDGCLILIHWESPVEFL